MVPWVSRLPEDAAALLKTASAASVDIHETATAVEQPAEPDRLESAMPAPAVIAADPVSTEQTGESVDQALQEGDKTSAVELPTTTMPADVGLEQTSSAAASDAGASPPAAIESLGQWLLQQTLAPIEFRGGLHPVLGVADAPVLVVLAQDAPSPTAGSMAGDDGRLFELMLRSIALSNRDTRRCQLDSRPGTASASADDALLQAGVGGLCSAGTRGVLMLMNPWSFDVADTAVEQHQSRLPESGLPLWRIAHPSILLEQPQLKRQAWQVLKRLRATLDGAAL